MTWGDPLPKAPSKDQEPWLTNERIFEEWTRYVSNRGAKNTQRNLVMYNGVFMRSFEEPVTTLNRQDIQNFLDRMSTKCKRYMMSDPPQCLWNHPIDTCPLLAGAPYESCMDYGPLEPSAVWSYITAINRMYNWLIQEQRMAFNPAYAVMKDFQSRHSAWFDDRRRKPDKRHLTLEEVRKLVLQSPIQHGTAYALMAKCFLRAHEVLKLVWEPKYCNLDDGLIDIPPNWELGNKRLGCTRIILDAEAKQWLRLYRVWWEDRVKRDEDGEPLTRRIIITSSGMPWGSGALGNFSHALRKNAIRIGLQPRGRSVPKRERIQSHSLRAFATTWARDADANEGDVRILRGDLTGGELIRYEEYLRRLPGLYQKHGPVLGLFDPPGFSREASL